MPAAVGLEQVLIGLSPMLCEMQHGALDDHAHRRLSSPLMAVLLITAAFAIIELAGGLLSGSLALISDSGHMFTDVLALALSVWASYISMRGPSGRQTFGFLRVEILVALINGIALVLISALIIIEAIDRIQHPVGIEAPLMLVVASAGLVANLAGVAILREKAHDNLNVKGAFMHIFGDMLSSIGVIVGAILIFLFDLRIADPIISLIISVIIMISAYRIITQSSYVLLEFTPGEIDVDKVRAAMKEVPGVVDVHDVHAWTIGSGVFALSAHVQVKDQPVSACSCIVKDCEDLLRDRFRISHSTLQLEYEECRNMVCSLRQATTMLEPGHAEK